MSNLIIKEDTLTAIADAIREKGETTAKLTPSEMVTAIGNISGGGGEYEDGEAMDW